MSKRKMLLVLVIAIMPNWAVASDFVIGTPGQIGAAMFGRQIGEGVSAGIELAQTKAAATAQIRLAREKFFSEYPEGTGFAEAEKEFGDLLWQKDLYFMMVSLPSGYDNPDPNSMANVFGAVDLITGGPLDGGISSEAEFRFTRWVMGMRESLGAQSRFGPLGKIPGPSDISAALKENAYLYRDYKKERDTIEFETRCRARPGPYCAGPGATSAQDSLVRAQKIADGFIANFGQQLPSDVKSNLRDAIINFESLSYSTDDCVANLEKSLPDGNGRAAKLSVLRTAVAKYQTAGVLAPEEICVRAAQDMQRSEHPGLDPTSKLLWDNTFRTAKFNEIYGNLTAEQAQRVADISGGNADYYLRRSTLIEFYAAGHSRETAATRSYARMRNSLIKAVDDAP